MLRTELTPDEKMRYESFVQDILLKLNAHAQDCSNLAVSSWVADLQRELEHCTSRILADLDSHRTILQQTNAIALEYCRKCSIPTLRVLLSTLTAHNEVILMSFDP